MFPLTYFRSLKTISRAGFLTLLTYSVTGNAQASDFFTIARSPENESSRPIYRGEAAQDLANRYISPMIAGLRWRSIKLGYPVHNLDRVRAEMDYAEKRAYNAWSYDRRGTKHIIVDLLFVLDDIIPYSTYGALATIHSDDLMERIAIDYFKGAVEARDLGKAFEPFRFSPDTYGHQYRHLQNIVGNDIAEHMIAFLVLHELGHVELGHTDADATVTPQLSREMEAEADNWAFKTMHIFDYSLRLLEDGFLAKAFIEETQKAVAPESISPSYPLWRERLTALVDFMQVNPPIPRGVRVLKGYGLTVLEGKTEPFRAMLLLGSPRWSNLAKAVVELSMFSDEKKKRVSVVEETVVRYDNDSTYVYSRSDKQLTEIKFEQPLSHNSMALWIVKSNESQPINSFPMRFYHVGIGSDIESNASEECPVKEIIDFDLTGFYEKFLSDRGTLASIRMAAHEINVNFDEEYLSILMAFSKGIRSRTHAEFLLNASKSRLYHDLVRALGDQLFMESELELNKICSGQLRESFFPLQATEAAPPPAGLVLE